MGLSPWADSMLAPGSAEARRHQLLCSQGSLFETSIEWRNTLAIHDAQRDPDVFTFLYSMGLVVLEFKWTHAGFGDCHRTPAHIRYAGRRCDRGSRFQSQLDARAGSVSALKEDHAIAPILEYGATTR